MKKNLVRKTFAAVIALMVLLFPLALLASEHSVRVNGYVRLMIVTQERDGVRFQFFDESGKRFLGEEIVQDGIKVYDGYIENNGEWTQQFYLRFIR